MTDPSPSRSSPPSAARRGVAARNRAWALRPFRSPGYRRLAVALALNMFASGVWPSPWSGRSSGSAAVRPSCPS